MVAIDSRNGQILDFSGRIYKTCEKIKNGMRNHRCLLGFCQLSFITGRYRLTQLGNTKVKMDYGARGWRFLDIFIFYFFIYFCGTGY